MTNEEKNSDENDTTENNKKRQTMDKEIYESFMHPKMFKTKSVDLNTTLKKKKEPQPQRKAEIPKLKGSGISKIKHKFNVSD